MVKWNSFGVELVIPVLDYMVTVHVVLTLAFLPNLFAGQE